MQRVVLAFLNLKKRENEDVFNKNYMSLLVIYSCNLCFERLLGSGIQIRLKPCKMVQCLLSGLQERKNKEGDERKEEMEKQR